MFFGQDCGVGPVGPRALARMIGSFRHFRSHFRAVLEDPWPEQQRWQPLQPFQESLGRWEITKST